MKPKVFTLGFLNLKGIIRMAEGERRKKLPRRKRPPESVREHAEKQARKKLPRESKLKAKLGTPLNKFRIVLAKEYNVIPMPNNKAGLLLGKKIHIIPKFLKNAWAELKLVTWPSHRTAIKLTFAVFVFAIIFATFVQIADMGFNKLFKMFLLK